MTTQSCRNARPYCEKQPEMGETAPPPTGARASLEIDANPMSFQKMGKGRGRG